MEAFERIQLAFKCPKALDDLQPCRDNWYCDGCQQMVYDFRGMSEDAILDAFMRSGRKLCGIYDADRIKVLPQKPRWYKYVPAAVMALGVTILNGCGFGDKQKPEVVGGMRIPNLVLSNPMGKVVIQPNTLSRWKHISSDHKANSRHLGNVKPPPVLGDIATIDEPTATKNDNYFVGAIEINPEFPGGDEALRKYLSEHIENTGDFKGRAFVQFTVEPDGTLSGITMLRSAGELIDLQIIKAIKEMPKWKPGMQSSKIIRTRFTLPINLSPNE